MCEFHSSNGNGFGDIWWTDNPIYFSSIDVMICGHIILRIITKYIAYYHIGELSARASIVNTNNIMWGLKDV